MNRSFRLSVLSQLSSQDDSHKGAAHNGGDGRRYRRTMVGRTTATRSPLNSRGSERPADSRHGRGKHPEGCALTMAMGDPVRVDVTDVRVFRRSCRPTAIERGRFQRPDRSSPPARDGDDGRRYRRAKMAKRCFFARFSLNIVTFYPREQVI